MKGYRFNGEWSKIQMETVRRIIQNPKWNPWTFYKYSDGTITFWRQSWDLRPSYVDNFCDLIVFLRRYYNE